MKQKRNLFRLSIKGFKLWLSLALIFILSFCCSMMVTAYQLESYHAQSGSTWNYYIDSAISSAGVYSIVVSDNQWNGISNRKVYLSQSATRTTQTTHIKDSKNEIFPYQYGLNAGCLASTRTWWNSSIAEESDTLLNVSFPLANDPVASSSYSVRVLVTHEMGHALGLHHSNGTKSLSGNTVTTFNDSIMFSGQPTGPVSYTLKQDDKDGYSKISW